MILRKIAVTVIEPEKKKKINKRKRSCQISPFFNQKGGDHPLDHHFSLERGRNSSRPREDVFRQVK
jgi:hypothetical protein